MSVTTRVLEKPPATLFSYLRYHGGIRPRMRCWRSIALSIEEPEEISRGKRFVKNVVGDALTFDWRMASRADVEESADVACCLCAKR